VKSTVELAQKIEVEASANDKRDNDDGLKWIRQQLNEQSQHEINLEAVDRAMADSSLRHAVE
jgi:hypothetical protein